MQQTLKEPDWVGEDALAMKRAATEARKARFTRRVRVPSPDERIKTRRDAYAGHLRRRTAGGPSPCLLYTSPSPRDKRQSRMPSSA